MPNHCVNEVIFRDVPARRRAEILEKVVGPKGFIDFSVLLPTPINSWPGSVGQRHEKAFPTTNLEFNRENWGTKWNAYGKDDGYTSIVQTDDTLTLTFQTAWSPPYGWLCAVFNTFEARFEHNWMEEGGSPAHADVYDYAKLDDIRSEAWSENIAEEAMSRHLHKLLWGVEEFTDEDE